MYSEQNASIEPPSISAERIGLEYAGVNTSTHKKELGQYFTPLFAGKFMACLASIPSKATVNILDPGCGTGVLSCSLVEEIVNNHKHIRILNLTSYELDANICKSTDEVYTSLKFWCIERGVKLIYKIINSDFIIDNTNNMFSKDNKKFDIIITNPPYYKISKKSKDRLSNFSLIKGANNIYAIFLAISISLLKDNGNLVSINPRSFASGKYFRNFREFLFRNAELNAVCLIESRRKTFAKDRVLQENIIIKVTKRNKNTKENLVQISLQTEDLYNNLWWCTFKFNDLVSVDTFNRVLYLPTSLPEYNAMEMAKGWTNTLNSLGFTVSTGPVVDFRSKEHLTDTLSKSTCPLIWYHNIQSMNILWPLEQKSRPQYIMNSNHNLLLKNKNYVIVRRFSPKEGKRRIVAAPCLAKNFQHKLIGIENHLNYIKRDNGSMTEEQSIGLSAILNSKIFDNYFRAFSGNINVSATELQEMSFPTIKIIENIGSEIIKKSNIDDNILNEIVNSILASNHNTQLKDN